MQYINLANNMACVEVVYYGLDLQYVLQVMFCHPVALLGHGGKEHASKKIKRTLQLSLYCYHSLQHLGGKHCYCYGLLAMTWYLIMGLEKTSKVTKKIMAVSM